MKRVINFIYYAQPAIMLIAAVKQGQYAYAACGVLLIMWLSVEGYKQFNK
jgi:hypothetical protein